MSQAESRPDTTFQSSSSPTMGVANKMSSDERSQQVVLPERVSEKREYEDGPSQPNVNEVDNRKAETLSPDYPALVCPNDDNRALDAVGESPANKLEVSLGPTSETKRKRGRPKKQADSVDPPHPPEPLTESEPMDVSTEVAADPTPKRIRTKPKRFSPDDIETPKGSESVPKRKRGRPPKIASDLSGSPIVSTVVNPVRDATGSPAIDAFKDPLEEDLSESSSDVITERWVNPDLAKTNPTRDDASPAPSSSASSSIGSSADSPLRVSGSNQKRQRGRPKAKNVLVEKQTTAETIASNSQTSDKPQPIITPPNGISPRKIHKKFGKFIPPLSTKVDAVAADLPNGLAESPKPIKEPVAACAVQEPSVTLSSPVQSMKVKSRWRLSSIEDSSGNSDLDQKQRVKDENANATVQQISSSLTSPKASPITSPNHRKVADEAELTRVEIEQRLSSFHHITENTFLCDRRVSKDSHGMECDCTMSKEDVVKGRKGCGNDCLNRLLFIECGKSCSLGKRCSNRRFQNVENAPTEVFKTDYKGFGVRATADIQPDTFIMEYVGEVLDHRQFRKRARKYASDDVQHFYFMALSSEYFIDASSKGNISRFINHSCDPNAETQKWTVNGELRVGFFSRRVIRKGDEITFDYKYERYGQHAQKCFCGAKTCRGWLGGEPDKENQRPVEESDDDYWSSSSLEDEEESVVIRPSHQQQQQQQQQQSEPVIRNNQLLSKTKKLQRKKILRSQRTIKKVDQEFEEEIDHLKLTGIKTKAHTVELCRLMVRVTDLNTKLIMASLIRTADPSCRRLFLDYHGLKLLYKWMFILTDDTEDDLNLKISIEDTLDSLTFPHKTMLKESGVLPTIQRWADPSREPVSEPVQPVPPSTESSRATTPDNSSLMTPTKTVISSLEVQTTPAVSVCQSVDKVSLTNVESAQENDVTMDESIADDCSTKHEMSFEDSKSVVDVSVTTDIDEPTVTSPKSPRSPEVKKEGSEISSLVDDDRSRQIVEVVASQKVENQDFGFEKVDDSSKPEVAPISKPQVSEKSSSENEKLDSEIESKIRTVRQKAAILLSQWINLQEVFKIPKKEMQHLRTKHELEVDRAAAEAIEVTTPRNETPKVRPAAKPTPSQSSYERVNHRLRPDSPNKRERRPSRFDDEFGKLQHKAISRSERRFFYTKKAELEEQEREKRLLQQQQHENKCYYLKLDPAITPMFPQHPEFFFDPSSSQWHQMPPPYPEIEVDWGYPGMALLPLQAFKLTDTPLPDPAYIYPPGVVPVSYCFGHPMSLDPSLLPVAPPLPPMPPPVDVNDIPLPSPTPQTYIDPDTGEEVPILEAQPGFVPDWADELAAVIASEKLARPDVAPHLQNVASDAGAPMTNGFTYGADPISWLAKASEAQPHYLSEHDSVPNSQLPEHFRSITIPGLTTVVQAASSTSNGKKQDVEKVEFVLRLPVNWKMGRDPDTGRHYFYNSKTRETSWMPPNCDDSATSADAEEETEMIEMETASTDSESIANEMEEDGEESDDEDDEDSDKEEDEENGNSAAENIKKILMPPNPENAIHNSSGDVLYSDLSAHEKELLLKASRKKSKEERQNERRFKRERDREKREYERKRRRERHGKHRRDGLVKEYIIPRRSERDKTDLMSFKELKDRLANRVQIREEQELEELAELEREREEERLRRVEQQQQERKQREQLKQQLKQQQHQAAAAAAENDLRAGSRTTTAAADTSSEVSKKIKDRFLKDASKVVVKLLDPYRRPDATNGRIQCVEDFKHLAKKLTNYLLAKESSRCKRIEDLKFTESVKKKSADYVKKYMAKFGDVYKKSP